MYKKIIIFLFTSLIMWPNFAMALTTQTAPFGLISQYIGGGFDNERVLEIRVRAEPLPQNIIDLGGFMHLVISELDAPLPNYVSLDIWNPVFLNWRDGIPATYQNGYWVFNLRDRTFFLSANKFYALIFGTGVGQPHNYFGSSEDLYLSGRAGMQVGTGGVWGLTTTINDLYFNISTNIRTFGNFTTAPPVEPTPEGLPPIEVCGDLDFICRFQNWLIRNVSAFARFLFAPSANVLNQFSELWPTISNRAPLGYFSLIRAELDNLKAENAGFILPTIPILSDIRAIVSVLIWFLFALWLIRRISRFIL